MKNINKYVEHTLLKPDATKADLTLNIYARQLALENLGDNWGGTLKRVVISLVILVILQNSVFLEICKISSAP